MLHTTITTKQSRQNSLLDLEMPFLKIIVLHALFLLQASV